MQNEKEILEGFNAGYIIEKHRPQLAKQMVENLKGVELPYIEGFVSGSKEAINEKEQTKQKSISKIKEFAKKHAPIKSPQVKTKEPKPIDKSR